jgi:SAM-dependent methyltransferase
MHDALKKFPAFLKDSDRYQIVDGIPVCTSMISEIDQLNVGAFYEKWSWAHRQSGREDYEAMQYQRYMTFYGFASEDHIKSFLSDKFTILDAGCGYGHKADWFARLAPHATVIAMDLSSSVYIGKELYGDRQNLMFIKGDISDTGFNEEIFDYVNCDQVLHHTQDPSITTAELSRMTKMGGFLALYVYAKKALPRELVDSYFLSKQNPLSNEDLWDLSDRLMKLGRTIYELGIEIDFPEIPQLGIKGGRQNIQRFLYENFLKCYWNEQIGEEQSISVNFDWYSPHIAHRFTQDEFMQLAITAKLGPVHTHSESACHTGLFRRTPR